MNEKSLTTSKESSELKYQSSTDCLCELLIYRVESRLLMAEEDSIESLLDEQRQFPPPEPIASEAHITDFDTYQAMWRRSIDDPDGFWSEVAEEFEWYKKWDSVSSCDLATGDIHWFEGAQLNVSVNCLDRHVAAGRGDAPAITFEADDGSSETFSFSQVLEKVSQLGNLLRANGVSKGDRVTIYMPMIPELAFALLACARIGAIHSVVFGGFSAESLAQRIVDCSSDVMMTTDAGIRGGRIIPLKAIGDAAIELAAEKGTIVRTVLVNHRAGDGVGSGAPNWVEGRDVDMDAGMKDSAQTCQPEVMEAEDPLFILYTSGSTGQPKGVMHTQAGYMVWTATTSKYVFDLHPERDLHFCTADIGWITGHSYIVYGPLALGCHTLMFEGTPTYPDAGRLWDICDKHKPTTFYTAPTAIRALMVHGDEPVRRYKRESIRVLGTVGEPINPEAWMWYHQVVGDETRPIVDTWWQTETGGIMITPLPGMTTTKPGSATYPFFGIDPKIVHADGSECEVNEGGYLIVEQAWPGMMRTVYGDHERFIKTYFSQQPGRYFTGDGARKDEDGCYWIMGRIDDVINVSGHRMGTAEVESALVEHPAVCEAAVVGFPHEIKGQGIYCFVTLEGGNSPSEVLRKELRQGVRSIIGPIATPDKVHFTQVLPKTRSGKIMRRILRKIAAGDISDMGDVSTLADPSVVTELVGSRPE